MQTVREYWRMYFYTYAASTVTGLIWMIVLDSLYGFARSLVMAASIVISAVLLGKVLAIVQTQDILSEKLRKMTAILLFIGLSIGPSTVEYLRRYVFK